ncbi:GNAT family N-acetyltransferase [Longimicrobium sp.]|uniref:GNAT family N-acetyltransferase n=1 Tax=Longimicrobium sp. TaxID=2029185 RepID=UPI002CB1AD56|nr:GNAT family N-acetyltransferase [Longimicrobium sp.]HSU16305.1 GNAT family N-acetyltransferase [Longimicrobium sp.]
MAEEAARVEVTRNEEKEQWEAHAGEQVGVLTYSESDGKLFLLHTEVPEALEGQGIGGRLVRAAMDYAREAGEKVVPFCPFARVWLERHQDYADLVAESD